MSSLSNLPSLNGPPPAGTYATPSAADPQLHAWSVDNAGVIVIDISGDEHGENENKCDKTKCTELRQELAAATERANAATERANTAALKYDNLKEASEGYVSDMLFDHDEVSRRLTKALKKLDEVNMKVGEYCTSARLSARERLRREEFFITQANFFEGTLAESELYVEQLKGEVAVLEECNWALMHPAPKRARHREYLGDDFLPLNFLTHG